MRRMLGALGTAAAALTLSGCWLVPGADVNRSSHNPFESTLTTETVDGLTEQWRWTAPLGPISGAVVSSAGVHVGSKCAVSTLNPASGAEVWGALVIDDPVGAGCDQTIGDQRAGDPYVVGQQVQATYGYSIPLHLPNFISSFSTRSFDAATGAAAGGSPGFLVARRGDVQATSTVQASGAAAAESEVTVAGRSFLHHAMTWGDTVPFAPTGFTLGADKLFNVGPAILASAPGTATFGHGVRAYSISEARPGCGPATAGFPGSPVMVECPLWATPTDGDATTPVLSADGATLFTRTTAGTLYAIDSATGAVNWTATGLGSAGMPALAHGTLFVPTGDGHVLLFDAAGCGAPTCAPDSPAGMDTGSGAPVTGVAVAGDVIYAASAGSVYASGECFTGEYCIVAWSGAGYGRPVVTNGQLYVTDGNATLIAYGLD